LTKATPDQQQAQRKQIENQTSQLWWGKDFARASFEFNPAELAAETGKLIRQYMAQKAYAAEHTDLAARAAAQQKTIREITAAGLSAKIEERLDAEANLSRNPDLESMYHWLAANQANSVYLDAFDERNNRAMSDIIINFNTDGATKKTIRIQNTYGLKTDVNLTRTSDILPGLAAALEALSPTQ
jgi:hypothetical protein